MKNIKWIYFISAFCYYAKRYFLELKSTGIICVILFLSIVKVRMDPAASPVGSPRDDNDRNL